MDPRNSLVSEFARLVCEIKPKSLVMENVPGIVNMVTPEGIPVLDALSLILEEGGMGSYEGLKKSLMGKPGASYAKRNSTSAKKYKTRNLDENQMEMF